MKLGDLAAALGCRLQGDENFEISGVLGMEHAGPGHLTFLANPKYGPKVKHTKASAILVAEPGTNSAGDSGWDNGSGLGIARLFSGNPYLDFARALALFYQPPRPAPGIHPMACIAPTAIVGENCSIGPFAVVGDYARIG